MSEKIEIPDRLYFRIGDVSSLAGVESYVLRFWETEFKNIRPKRTPSGQRLYRKRDVERILTIKRLLYEKKFTIEGAKQYLKRQTARKKKKQGTITLAEVRRELLSIKKLLE